MDDREIVAAIVAGDLAGLADAYDQYARSLYGYCRWMVTDPDDAADVIQDTFVIAAGMLGDLRDPRKLRPWLYAVARNECFRRLRTAEVGTEEAADLAGLAAEVSDDAERAELRRLVRAALSGLNPGEREVLELSLRHDFHGADLAAVLGVSRNQAHALASRARGQLEKALGALLVARTGRRACRTLDGLLADWDGRLTVLTRKRISKHADQCETCDNRRRAVMRPAALFGMAPLAALPRGLRGDVLRLCADDSQLTLAYRREVMLRAGAFRPNGFPPPIRAPRQRIVALSRIAAAAGIVIALASAGVVTALALGGSPAPHSPDAARASSRPATASATADASPSPLAPPSTSPAGSPATIAEPAPAIVPSASASATAKPSPSRSATTSASAQPSPSRSGNSPTPTPTPTPTSTATSLPTPTPTPSVAAGG
jgi:RNA polymerase sigma factor (sigma-70 family)